MLNVLQFLSLSVETSLPFSQSHQSVYLILTSVFLSFFFPFFPLTSSPSYLPLPPPSHFISISLSCSFPPPLPLSGQLSLCLLYSASRFVTDLSCQPCDWPLGSAKGDEAILISSGLAAKLVVFSTRTVAAE